MSLTIRFIYVFLLLVLVDESLCKLEKDNKAHRSFSNKLDRKFCGQGWYDKAARPIIHGVYHTGRAIRANNDAEWARAKDQFSKIGTGQSQTDYLKQYQK